ncbi:MAG: hypothetical protein H6Q65_2301 [Firmicutes bacterium]|nr:hypothetical protein [Bacillota bacterium]
MKIFTTLFGSPRAKKVYEAREKFRKKTSALRSTGDAIADAAETCYRKTLPLLNRKEEKERQLASVYLYYEYLYFFRHIVLREAFIHLSISQMNILHEYIAGVFTPRTIDKFLKQWPQEMRSDLRTGFFERLNDIEANYGNSRELFVKKDPCSSDALSSKVSRNVAYILEDPNNLTTIRTVVMILTEAYHSMKLKNLIGKAKQHIKIE